MQKRGISVAIISLGLCALAIAAEYKAPDVGFKAAKAADAEVKSGEFKEDYKVEGIVKTDRQIASENDLSDREPSSIKAEDKKKMMDEWDKGEHSELEPKPWLYRNKLDSAY